VLDLLDSASKQGPNIPALFHLQRDGEITRILEHDDEHEHERTACFRNSI